MTNGAATELDAFVRVRGAREHNLKSVDVVEGGLCFLRSECVRAQHPHDIARGRIELSFESVEIFTRRHP